MGVRIYFRSAGETPVSVTPDAGWEDISQYERFFATFTKGGGSQLDFAFFDINDVDKDCLLFQLVTPALPAQTIPAQTLKLQIVVLQAALVNNMSLAAGVRVVSNDGTIVRGTLASITRDSIEMASSYTNRGLTLSVSALAIQNGDRIVIEIGAGGDPDPTEGHGFNGYVGASGASDLPEDDTTTNTSLNPWLEFPLLQLPNPVTIVIPSTQVVVQDFVTSY